MSAVNDIVFAMG